MKKTRSPKEEDKDAVCRLCIYMKKSEHRLIKQRAKALYGGNISLYLRTLGAK